MNKIRRAKLQKAYNQLDNIKDIINDVMEEEQESFDNLSEGLQMSERGERMEENVDTLSEIIDSLDEVRSQIDDVIN